MGELADIARETYRVFRHRPDVVLALTPPWGLLPAVRRWAIEQINLEETEAKLRAVIPADEMDAVMEWIDDALERLNAYFAEKNMSPVSRLEVMRAYLNCYCTTGEHPKLEDFR